MATLYRDIGVNDKPVQIVTFVLEGHCEFWLPSVLGSATAKPSFELTAEIRHKNTMREYGHPFIQTM